MIDIVHIHPIVVHFPIVLFLVAVVTDFLVLSRGADLAAKDCLATVGMAALVLAALAAIVAVFFGDIALEKAMELGFDEAPLERHEDLGHVTMFMLVGLGIWRVLARWRGFPLGGGFGWSFFAAGLAGLGVLLATAYFGGELVYGLGVNVAAVKP